MAIEMVHTTYYTEPQDDQSWLVNRMTDGIREAQLDLSLFMGDETKEQQYFASLSPDDFNAWLKSGIPVGKVTDTGLFGPYDPAATDGRQLKVYGFLESQLHVVFTRSGFEDQYPTVGIRYMAVIDRTNLPVTLPDGTLFEGLILDYEKATGGDVTVLSPAATASGESTAPGANSITSAMLAAGAVNTAAIGDGQVTGAKLAAKTVTKDKIADGVIPTVPAAPTWANISGKPAPAAAIADLTAAPTADDVNKILAVLRTAGFVAAK